MTEREKPAAFDKVRALLVDFLERVPGNGLASDLFLNGKTLQIIDAVTALLPPAAPAGDREAVAQDVPDSDILAAISEALVAAEEHDLGPEATVLSGLRSLGLLTGSIGKDWPWPLPCDVLVAPKTVIGRGVSLGTLVTALKQRERWVAEGEIIPRLSKAALSRARTGSEARNG